MSKKSKHLDKDVIPRGNPEHYVLHHFFISYSSVNSDDASSFATFCRRLAYGPSSTEILRLGCRESA